MVAQCENLNQEDKDDADICPGVAVLQRIFEERFQELTDAIKEGMAVHYEQGTGFAWDERAKVKCILGWAKRAKDEDNRVKAWVWGLYGSLGTGLTVGLIMWFLKTKGA